jgi:predicted permease
MAVRAALGAGRGRLIRQVLTESACLAGLGAGLGTLLAAWLVRIPAAVTVAAPDLFVPYRVTADEMAIDGRVLLFTVLVTVATTILVGIAPALRAARFDPAESLRGGTAGPDGTRRVRAALVIGEIALSVTLLVAAGLLVRSFARLTDIDPGFRPDRVLTVEVNLPSGRYGDDARSAAFFGTALERIRSLPGVRAAGAAEQLPLSGPTQGTDFRIIGAPEPPQGQAPRTPYGSATPGYFAAMGMTLVRGRTIESSDDAGAARVMVVSEAFARRFFPGENAIGRRVALSIEALRFDRPDAPPRLDFPGAAREIVGIVSDVRQEGIATAPAPMAYVPAAQRPSRDMTLAILAVGDPLALVPAVRAEVARIDPEQPLTAVSTMHVAVAGVLGEPRSRTTLATAFAVFATLLTAVGIYGVISYAVTRRRHELGVRLALGAVGRDVVTLVVREGLMLALAGLAIGLAGALVAARGIAGMLYDTPPTDAVTFAAVISLVVFVSLAASWIPAWRASRLAPLEALRVDG